MIRILFKDDNPHFQNRIDYVLRFIEQHPLVQGQLVFTQDESMAVDEKLYYGMEQEDAFYMPAQKVVFSKVLPDFDRLYVNSYSNELMQLYAIEQKRTSEQAFIQAKKFQFDLMESIFFHISRIEEYYCKDQELDAHQRMHSKYQMLVRHQLHRIPVVDHLVLAFAKALGLNHPSIPTKYRMTHDIDFIKKTNGLYGQLRTIAAAILKMRDIKRAVRVLKDKTKNPFDTFDWLLLEQPMEKVIYFLVGGQSRYDAPYDLNDATTQKAFRLAQERGYQIGIHPSYHTWKTPEMMAEEKAKLEKAIGAEVKISRQHYLRFSFKHTPEILEQLSIQEDSTMGYGDRIGFRCGTGFPYRLYNFEKEKAFGFIEVPLVFMESALLEETKFKAETLVQLWKSFLSQNAENTRITFNFHNSRFYDAALSGIDLKQLYLTRLSNP